LRNGTRKADRETAILGHIEMEAVHAFREGKEKAWNQRRGREGTSAASPELFAT